MQKAGVLDKYYTEFYFKPESLSGSLLISLSNNFSSVKKVAARLCSNRYMEGLCPQNVVSVPLPEFLGRGWRHVPLLRRLVAGNLIADNLFDFLVSRRIGNCDIFHGWLGYSLNTIKKLRENKTKVLLDMFTAHPDYSNELLKEEYVRFGLNPVLCNHTLREKYLDEIREADFLVAPSQYVYDTCVAKGVPEKRMRVIPFGVDLKRFRPIEKQDDVFRLIYVGAVSLNKGIHYLLEAFKQLRLPNSELVLIGRLQPEFKSLLSKYEGRFKHISHIPNDQLTNWYGNSSVFVFPSLTEGSALVTYEAMACGLPSIVSQNSGSVVRDNIDGFVIPIRDIETLKEKILFFYQNDGKRKEMGESARKHVENFTWGRYGEKLMEFYKEIYNAGGASQRAGHSGAISIANSDTKSVRPGVENRKNNDKIIVVTNIISPYRIPMLNQLAEEYGKCFKVIFARRKDHYRQWKLEEKDKIKFNFSVLNDLSIKLKNWEIHLSLTLLPRLVKEAPQVVISGGFSFQTIFSWLYSKSFKRKFIIWSAETIQTARHYGKLRHLLRKLLTSQADGFVVSGSLAQEYLLSLGVREDSIFLAYYSVAPQLLRLDKKTPVEGERPPEEKKRILYVGRFTKLKGVDILIQAYKRVKREYPNIQLCLVGDGPDEDEFKKLAHRTDDIFFEGYKQYDQLLPYYSNSHLFVLPTLKDVWGLVVNEAMMCGLPVICSKYAGCSRDLIKDGENGLIVDPKNPKELSETIYQLVSKDGDLSHFGNRSREIIKDFTTERTTRGFVRAVESVCSR